MATRPPAVAGGFYPHSRDAVSAKLRQLFGMWEIDASSLPKRKRVDCCGVVVPHAGWDYSGYVAARVFADIPKVGTVILMGPNHYGMGPDFSVSSDDAWETPLGIVGVDTKLAGQVAKLPHASLDGAAHSREHSIEVQLPLLQAVLGAGAGKAPFKIVPVSIKHYAPDAAFLSACRAFGEGLADIVSKLPAKSSLIVASTDFTHYEPQAVAAEKDAAAMAKIAAMDEAGLFKTLRDMDISMCGYGGVAAAIAACRKLGAKKAEKVAYMTSGDTTGDASQVVGYGGMRFV